MDYSHAAESIWAYASGNWYHDGAAGVPYVRKDLHAAEIARLTAALEAARAERDDQTTKRATWELAAKTVEVECDALTTALVEAEAALARLIAEAKAEGMREADTFDDLISEARTEAGKAMRKFPQPNYVISKIAEEAGEVVKAAIHAAEGRETMDNLRGEMRQVIAMLYRLWVEGDQVHGLGPVAPAAAKEPKP